MLRNEIEAVLARDGRGLEVDFVDGALHDYPDKLRAELQERIDAIPGDCDVYLSCARCSNGTVGLRGGEHRLVLPAADDCISLLLGSRARYLEEHGAQPGTYYYTRGWIDFIEDPYKEYLKIVPKYGEEKSARVARMIMEHYTRVAVIETPGVTGLGRQAGVPRDGEPLLRPAARAPHGLAAVPREAGERTARRGVHRRRGRGRAGRVPLLGALRRLTPRGL